MTATSGPGFSLMQEFIGYAFMTETPIVIVNNQRAGPSTGQATKCGQGDVMQSRWGTHGDYSAIVLSPNSVQEMFTLTIRAFNLAEQYRTPVILLSDEITAHMREQVTIPKQSQIEIINRKKPRPNQTAFFGKQEIPPMPSIGEGHNVTVTGSTHDEYGIRSTANPTVHRTLIQRLNDKIQTHTDQIADLETNNTANCHTALLSYGCTSRATYEAAEEATKNGVKTGIIRLRTLWPFPEKQIRKHSKTARTIIVPEMNLKQIYYPTLKAANTQTQVIPLNKIGGGELLTPEEILTTIMENA
jgi:2-oxoglutarate ferredoxin oxidoreductase subunit alpha